MMQLNVLIVPVVTGWVLATANAFVTPSTHRHVRTVKNKSSPLFTATTTDASSLPRIIPTKGVPIHLYTNEVLEDDCLGQLQRLAESPIPTDYVSAMPDVHWGMGVTIGTVFASEKYVCPNAVGVDIGCGMVRKIKGT